MQFIVFMFLFTALCKPSFQSLPLVTTMKEGHSWLPYCGQNRKKTDKLECASNTYRLRQPF